jgi:hypothetical protein
LQYLSTGTPLTAEEMAERLGFGCPRVLRRNFPAQYQALLGKRMAYEEAQRKQLRFDQISALAENPAPTVPAVCRRLGISTSRVYCLHGDLARAIAARHLRERAESTERRRELLRTEMFAIVKNMLARGEHPIQARVQKMLSADSLKAWKTLGRFLNEATESVCGVSRG